MARNRSNGCWRMSIVAYSSSVPAYTVIAAITSSVIVVRLSAAATRYRRCKLSGIKQCSCAVSSAAACSTKASVRSSPRASPLRLGRRARMVILLTPRSRLALLEFPAVRSYLGRPALISPLSRLLGRQRALSSVRSGPVCRTLQVRYPLGRAIAS